MAQDSLGKKTHMACVLELFQQANQIWQPSEELELSEAHHILAANKRVINTFKRIGWPFDKRSQQAYIHRFFNWLELPEAQQNLYPVKILAVGDSIQLRQCLWIDFIFGTPEAARAVDGLYDSIISGGGTFEVSPTNHSTFCTWLGIPKSDNTRRGPFARWLEDVGFAVPKPDRRPHETAVYVDMCGKKYSTTEALIYSLTREFADPFDGGGLRSVNISMKDLLSSFSRKILFLKPKELLETLKAAQKKGYVRIKKGVAIIDPNKFALALVENGPFPSQNWIQDHLDIANPMDRSILEELINFPDDQCEVEGGTPFVPKAEMETIKRRVRDGAFRPRVSSAYRYQCALTGFKFRSVSKTSWYGDAAHIVPHSGVDRNGNKIYGSSEISNGIFFHNFIHWCFDRGWISIEPKKNSKHKIENYTCRVATVAVDAFFEREGEKILGYDGVEINKDLLPAKKNHWPSIEALEWHMGNIFDG